MLQIENRITVNMMNQISEGVPEAFRIAANAMGVEPAQFKTMLEQGQVMAEDFIPKFAKQLQIEFGA
jgi:tape measure domain-containing protein